MEYKGRKKETKPRPGRGENWTSRERDVFLEIMRQSAPIVENKLTNTETNKKKYYEWLRVQKKLKERNGNHREVAQLKGYWSRLKTQAKKHFVDLKQGTYDVNIFTSPTDQDQKIRVLCQPDFDSDVESYDKIDNSKDGEESNEMQNSAFYNSNNEDTRDGINSSETNCKIEREDPREGETEDTYKEILSSKLEQSNRMLEEEHDLKMKYHRQELAHQELRHKLEIDILVLEKEKKELEIRVLKKTLE